MMTKSRNTRRLWNLQWSWFTRISQHNIGSANMGTDRAIVLLNHRGITKKDTILSKIGSLGYHFIAEKKTFLTPDELLEFYSIQGPGRLCVPNLFKGERQIDLIVLCVQRDECFEALKSISATLEDCVYVSKDKSRIHREIKYFFPNLSESSTEDTQVKRISPFLETAVFPTLIESILATRSRTERPNQNKIQILRGELKTRNAKRPLICEPQSSCPQ